MIAGIFSKPHPFEVGAFFLVRPAWAAPLNGLDPELYLRTVLAQIADYPISQIQDLLPWNVAASLKTHSSQAV